MEHLWVYSSVILAIVLFSKLLSSKTHTVDVLWLIIFGSLAANLGILPEENEILEAIGDWGIVFVMFALGFEENVANHKRDAEFVLNHLAFTIFGPIFFVMLGTKLVFESSLLFDVLPIALLLYGAVLVLQVLSAGLAARFTGGYAWHESVMIGLGMLGRAELAFIVIDIAYVENGLITTGQFYALMITIFLLNITVPLAIKWWKPYYLGKKTLRIGDVLLSAPSHKSGQ